MYGLPPVYASIGGLTRGPRRAASLRREKPRAGLRAARAGAFGKRRTVFVLPLDFTTVFLRTGFLWILRAAGLRFVTRALPGFRADRDLADGLLRARFLFAPADLERARFRVAVLGRLRVAFRETLRPTLRRTLRTTLRRTLRRTLRTALRFAVEALCPLAFLRFGRAAGRFFFRFTVRFGALRIARFTDRFFVFFAGRFTTRLRAVFFCGAGFFLVFLRELFFFAMSSSHFRHALDMIYRIASELFRQHDDADVAAVKMVPPVREQQRCERFA